MQKQSFFNENDKRIEEQRKISDIYVRQPIRSLKSKLVKTTIKDS